MVADHRTTERGRFIEELRTSGATAVEYVRELKDFDQFVVFGADFRPELVRREMVCNPSLTQPVGTYDVYLAHTMPPRGMPARACRFAALALACCGCAAALLWNLA
jgi:hypothetical protein